MKTILTLMIFAAIGAGGYFFQEEAVGLYQNASSYFVGDVISEENKSKESEESEEKEVPVFTRVAFSTYTTENIPSLELRVNVEHNQSRFLEIEREGYIFLGWSTTEYKEDIFKTITFSNQNDRTFHAIWEPIETKITYNFPHLRDEIIGYNEDFIPVSPTAPKGHEFTQWYIDEEKTIPWSSDFLNQVETYTLHPHFEPKEYTITFKEETVKEEVLKYGDSLSPIMYTPEKEYNDFIGWFTNETLTQEFNMETLEDFDLTLYPKFLHREHTLTYFGWEYDIIEPITIKEGNPIPELPFFENEYEVILDWYTEDTFETKFTLENMPNSDVQIYAQTKNRLWNVLYWSDGVVVESFEINYEDVIPHHNENVAGYRFMGWYYDEDFQTLYQQDDLLSERNDINIFGYYEKEYTLEYNGVGINFSSRVYIEGEEIHIPNAPSRTGYTFISWVRGTTTTGLPISEGLLMPADHLTITAVYERNQYEITFAQHNHLSPITILYNATVPALPDGDDKNGGEFLYWLDPHTNQQFSEGDKMPARNVRLEPYRDYDLEDSGDGSITYP